MFSSIARSQALRVAQAVTARRSSKLPQLLASQRVISLPCTRSFTATSFRKQDREDALGGELGFDDALGDESVDRPIRKQLLNEGNPGPSLFVGGIPYRITEDEIRQLFSHFGVVERVKIGAWSCLPSDF